LRDSADVVERAGATRTRLEAEVTTLEKRLAAATGELATTTQTLQQQLVASEENKRSLQHEVRRLNIVEQHTRLERDEERRSAAKTRAQLSREVQALQRRLEANNLSTSLDGVTVGSTGTPSLSRRELSDRDGGLGGSRHSSRRGSTPSLCDAPSSSVNAVATLLQSAATVDFTSSTPVSSRATVMSSMTPMQQP
jgi:hypothetical protein